MNKKVIYKYSLALGETKIKGKKLFALKVKYKGNSLFLWAENTLSEIILHPTGFKLIHKPKEEDYLVTVLGTGDHYDSNKVGDYIDTVIDPDGFHIWHVFIKEV